MLYSIGNQLKLVNPLLYGSAFLCLLNGLQLVAGLGREPKLTNRRTNLEIQVEPADIWEIAKDHECTPQCVKPQQS